MSHRDLVVISSKALGESKKSAICQSQEELKNLRQVIPMQQDLEDGASL